LQGIWDLPWVFFNKLLRMKKIADYRKILGVGKTVDLAELKTIYRNFMKEFHPDRFQDDNEREAAEERSKEIIEAYHFLVSIAPETLAQTASLYAETTSTASILDFEYKSQVLKVQFSDGSTYEYFEVPRNIYLKLINADSPGRFARRHIYNSFPYRSMSKLVAA
jgi:hypothetical protein